ncbi:hypothetical protein VIGAN_03099900 [Vigna angularis var. angularis]|uniref:Uncharacterized protein n=1 Tax=Vigna angularis var. angularis TaxID=157739 RepID=A0A0S3RLB3_PHAAN|nr:hypothetical protein VIGAN_03099900 [Vigna angularis var. angularis]
MRCNPAAEITFHCEGSILHFSKKSEIFLLDSSPLRGSMWKPETPSTIISAGPPWLVAKVGNPQFIASMTVNPNASYKAGCTNAPLVSAMQR